MHCLIAPLSSYRMMWEGGARCSALLASSVEMKLAAQVSLDAKITSKVTAKSKELRHTAKRVQRLTRQRRASAFLTRGAFSSWADHKSRRRYSLVTYFVWRRFKASWPCRRDRVVKAFTHINSACQPTKLVLRKPRLRLSVILFRLLCA